MIKNNKIVVTGGSGRFAQSLKKIKSKYNFIYPNKKKLNITNTNSIFNLNQFSIRKIIIGEIKEAMSSTERMRRYNKKHPEKVKQNLKKTPDDRVTRK